MYHLASCQALSPALRRAVALAVFALAAAPLGAQTASQTSPVFPDAPDNKLTLSPMFLDLQFEHDFSANLKKGAAGNLTSSSYQIQIGQTIDYGSKTFGWGANQLALGVSSSYINNTFSGINPVPFANVQKLGFQLHDDYGFESNYIHAYVFAHVNAGFAAETVRSLSSGGQFSVALGPTFVLRNYLTISAGPMYYSRMQDADTVTLYADATWTPAAQWTIKAYAGVSNGVSVAYDIFNNQATVADASVEYNSRWFRARDTAAGLKQAVDETDTTVKFGVRQAMSPACFIRGYVSAILGREYQFHTNGNSANSFDVNSIFGLGLEIGGQF